MPKKSKLHASFFKRHKTLLIIGGFFLSVILIFVAVYLFSLVKSATFQNSLSSFYDTQGLATEGPPGEVIRSEPVKSTLQNGSAKRILYRTQRADGSYTFSSGLLYTPKIPVNNTPLFVWAHGTIGLADQCAPSRQETIGSSWVDEIMQKGWVVVATDYAGFGTPGTQGYLIGGSEAHDVLNSVRAAHNLLGNQIGKNYAIWGHSQGGHSAIFSSALANSYLPEYNLIGTAATAPATELKSLFQEQYQTAAGWVIGPYVVATWPSFYKNLQIDGLLTRQGMNNYKTLANKCVVGAALDGTVREWLGQKFFEESFLNSPSWGTAISQQTAPTLSATQPLFVGESLTDQVVLPNTTAQYIQRACNAGSNLTSLWLTDVGHIQLQSVIAPSVINWISDRFANRSNSPTCNQPLPISPANN